MAETQHTLQETIDLAVKLAVQKAKLDMHPIGKTWLTFGDENPADIVGGVWERVKTYCLQCSDDDHAAGTVIEAGLPNIKSEGSPYVYQYTPNGVSNTPLNSGCLTWNNNGGGVQTGQYSGTGSGNFYIDASKSSPIYGKSETVQPNSIIINVWKRIK